MGRVLGILLRSGFSGRLGVAGLVVLTLLLVNFFDQALLVIGVLLIAAVGRSVFSRHRRPSR